MRDFIIFTRHLFRMLFFVRGVLLILLVVLLAFALITALTVDFGDITLSLGVTRTIMVLAEVFGVVFVGLVVAVPIRALELAVEEEWPVPTIFTTCQFRLVTVSG